jgi:hypothetical protein
VLLYIGRRLTLHIGCTSVYGRWQDKNTAPGLPYLVEGKLEGADASGSGGVLGKKELGQGRGVHELVVAYPRLVGEEVVPGNNTRASPWSRFHAPPHTPSPTPYQNVRAVQHRTHDTHTALACMSDINAQDSCTIRPPQPRPRTRRPHTTHLGKQSLHLRREGSSAFITAQSTSVCSFRVVKEPMELPPAGGSFIATRSPQGVVRSRTRPDIPSPSTWIRGTNGIDHQGEGWGGGNWMG